MLRPDLQFPKERCISAVLEAVARHDPHTNSIVMTPEEYSAAGVRECWVIDRFGRRMTVFRGDAEQIAGESDVDTTPFVPRFALPLSRLLASADEWWQES